MDVCAAEDFALQPCCVSRRICVLLYQDGSGLDGLLVTLNPLAMQASPHVHRLASTLHGRSCEGNIEIQLMALYIQICTVATHGKVTM